MDFESFYDQAFSLTKVSTEEYIRSPKFETIGFSYKINDEAPIWVTGDEIHIADTLGHMDWSDSLILCHNTMFDGAIMSWRYGVKPKGWLDTLSMGRALHGTEVGGSLKALAERYQIGVKGTEVLQAIGMNRLDFDKEELAAYGEYCKNDVELTYKLFHKMMAQDFPKIELKLIDLTLQMYIDPVLTLDKELLSKHMQETVAIKNDFLVKALVATGQQNLAVKQVRAMLGDEESKTEVRAMLMSNPKFAEMLGTLGVEAPTKISPTTGKVAFALAKTDEGFKALLEHEDVRVQAICAARLGTKSTIEESRTQRFIDIAERGLFPIPLKYYAAHTGRWGGTDSINLQNLPSRGANAGKLKKAILAPEGYVFIDADSAQIEARCLAWLAEQDDLVKAFANKQDVYKLMAASIYNKKVEDILPAERFVGKTTILGCGYGMGGLKFQAQLKTFGTTIEEEEAKRIVAAYRTTYPQISELWKLSQVALRSMVQGTTTQLGRNGLLTVDQQGIKLPNGLHLHYAGISEVLDDEGKKQFVYTTRKGPNKIYGGKLVENYTQAIARCIIGEQMLKIARKYKVVLTVHDAIGIVAREEEAEEARDYVESCMRWVPSWAEGLPVDCESGMGKSYGDC